ncbi:MAG TPA: peptidase C15, partial [Coleofasciculaceae cyanobacterium]
MKTALLTSFVSWQPWQASNSADDLLQDILCTAPDPDRVVLRGLPVNLPVARNITIAKIRQLQPQVILLCGMAETRQKLSLESTGVLGDRQLHT